MDLSLPRGIRDLEPEEQEYHSRIRGAFEEVAKAYNFRMMEPAPLESLSVLRAKSGAAVDEEIYAFKDKAGRDVGLRFDLTVGMTRYAVSRRDLKPPTKLASYGGVWRYDEPQHARYRWFHQWDIEIFGDPSVDCDAEVMSASYDLFRKLGLSVSLQVGDRRVVEEYVQKNLKVDSEEKALEMMRALDKVKKKTDDELMAEYEQKGIEWEELRPLLEFGRIRGTPDAVTEKLAGLGVESASELSMLADSLNGRGVDDLEFDLSIVRGLDYYTAIVFEVVDRAHGDLGALCGGGRYDALPRMFGRPDLVAVGAAGGVERIALSLGGKAIASKALSVFVAFTEPDLANRALEVLTELRGEGIRSEMGNRGKKLSKQMEVASEGRFALTVIIGKREVESGQLTVRDMTTRSEEKVPAGDLLSRVREKKV